MINTQDIFSFKQKVHHNQRKKIHQTALRTPVFVLAKLALGLAIIFSIMSTSVNSAQIVPTHTRRVRAAETAFSLDQASAAETADYTANLVQIIDTSSFSPPSPDPAGIAYIDSTKTLLFSDSEVNEMPIFSGDNLFEIGLSGNLLDTTTTITFSGEPTGVAYNLLNGHIFISDDNAMEIYEIDPGPDHKYGTIDDTVTHFDTLVFNCADPEGVAFDYLQGALFIVDATNAEVYRVSPGINDVFDGIPPQGDDQVTSFDTLNSGINFPQGIAFNPTNQNLYVVGKPTTIIAEFTTAGDLVQMIDISAANARQPSGLTYAPGSQDQNARSIYITERGVDNNFDPNENDGKVYELSMPSMTPVPPIAYDDFASTIVISSVSINAAANDIDPNGNLDPASTNTVCDDCTEPSDGSLTNNNDGSFTYTPDPGFLGDDSFVYQICDTDLLCDTATVTITTEELTIFMPVISFLKP